jgi:hypothetical protein
MERAGTTDIDGRAARVAASESSDERVNLWIIRESQSASRDVSTPLDMTSAHSLASK